MGQCMGQIRLTTRNGIKGKDDFLDTISMLGYLTPWKPMETPAVSEHDELWDEDEPKATSALESYIA
jgi:hypothetical protein